MVVDRDFYSRRFEEESKLATAARTRRLRNFHARCANEYSRELSAASPGSTPEAVAEWKSLRRSEAFGDWLADVL